MGNALQDLKSEREKRNISLDKIAAETRISIRYLQSIEEGRFEDLPGGVYNRAFIKAYCESIHLDPEEILTRYQELKPSLPPEKHSTTIIPLSEPGLFSIPAPVIIWSLVLVAAALGVYLSRGWIAETFSPYFSSEKETVENFPAPVENPQLFDDPYAEANSQQPAAVPADSLMALSPEETPPSAPENSATDYAAEELISPAKVIHEDVGSADAKIRIELSATEPCWISVSIDGAPADEKVMRPGGTELFFVDTSVRVKIGNAGGVRMKINGKPTKPLGGRGKVVTMDINPLNVKQLVDLEEE